MRYSEINKIIKKIEEDIDHVNEFPDIDSFINTYFSQSLGMHNEYSDNSLDLAYQYKNLKDIDNNKELLNILKFVLHEYVRSSSLS